MIHKLFVATLADKERHKRTVSTAKNDTVTDTVCSLKLRENSLTFSDSRWRSQHFNFRTDRSCRQSCFVRWPIPNLCRTAISLKLTTAAFHETDLACRMIGCYPHLLRGLFSKAYSQAGLRAFGSPHPFTPGPDPSVFPSVASEHAVQQP